MRACCEGEGVGQMTVSGEGDRREEAVKTWVVTAVQTAGTTGTELVEEIEGHNRGSEKEHVTHADDAP